MLSDLKFVQGAVARKDYAEEMCHLLIKDKTAVAYDGLLSMSTTINIDLHVKPHARTLARALQACGDENEIKLSRTKGGKLSVTCGKFRALVNCLDDEKEMNHPLPQGQYVEPSAQLLESLKALAPFMGIDASRPWAMGLRISGSSTYATNNIVLVERWHGAKFPFEIIIPADAVKELIRINQDPVLIQVDHGSITFHYENDRWLRTQLVDGQWPDNLERVFNMEATPSPIPEGFFAALETLRTFNDDLGRVYVHATRLSTASDEGEGAHVELDTGANAGIFILKQLQLLDGVATSIALDAYPKPCPFRGDKLRGVILGLQS